MSKLASRLLLVVTSVFLVQCSGGSGSSPPPPTYQLAGSVSGLAGTGLVLHSSLGDNLPVSANGAFAFPTKATSGTAYAVTVSVQPTGPSQECTVSSGAGTIASADVSNVSVTCTTRSFHVGGTVAGLVGTGLELQNGTDVVSVDPDLNPTTAFTFTGTVPSGGSFSVSVKTQPSSPTQTCTVSGETGTVGGGDVTTVTVNCSTDAFTIGGTISGLAGTGLVLENNGEQATINVADGTFAFATPVASGDDYDVTITTNPTSPWQECLVTGGQGTVVSSNITSIDVACTTKYLVSGTVSGVLEPGLVLQNNGGDDIGMDADGVFTFATRLVTSDPYAVTVLTDPPTQTCSVALGDGAIASADVEDVTVTCTCSTGLGNCDDTVAGCETSLVDNVDHCGACDNACPARDHATAACVASTCGFACDLGFLDCDGNETNGCESNWSTDVVNCGACGNACPAPQHAAATCSGGACGFACSPNWGDCNTDAGCETDLRGNNAHCGACNNACAIGTSCTKPPGEGWGCH